MTNYEYFRDNGYKGESLRDMTIEICKHNYGSCEKCCSDVCDRALTETRDWLMLERALYPTEDLPVVEEAPI